MNSTDPQAKRSHAYRLPLLLLLLALAVAGFWLLRTAPGGESQQQGNLAGSAVGGPFTLVDENGRTVTSDSFAGKWRLMYFGFTYCPDVCPTDAAKLAAGLKAFEARHPEKARQLQPLFLTVDPERDTPAVVAEFTDSFHPRLLGLTGSREQVEAALKAFRVYAAKVEGPAADAYTYDHLAIFYLMDPEGRPVQFIAGPTATPEAIADMLERFVA